MLRNLKPFSCLALVLASCMPMAAQAASITTPYVKTENHLFVKTQEATHTPANPIKATGGSVDMWIEAWTYDMIVDTTSIGDSITYDSATHSLSFNETIEEKPGLVTVETGKKISWVKKGARPDFYYEASTPIVTTVQWHSYIKHLAPVLTAVPEPGGVAMVLAGLVGLFALRRRPKA